MEGAGRLPEVVNDRPEHLVSLVVDTEELAVTESVYGSGERGPPPHVHHRHADGFLVVEGELTFTLRDGSFRAPAGTFVLVPPDVVHSFETIEGGSARFLNFHAPSCGFGEYLRGRNPGFDQHDPPADGDADPATVVVTRLDD
jgi:mannose-6-phosphate isomerase-like protein (cupin superfamily)